MRASIETVSEQATAAREPIRQDTALINRCEFPGIGHALTTRRWQTLPLTMEQAPMLYAVETGVLGLEITPPNRAAALLSIAMPGDVLSALSVPKAVDARIVVLQAGNVRRLREATEQPSRDARLADTRGDDERQLRHGIERHQAASLLHTSVISHLSGGERIASILLALALRLGQKNDTGNVTFEMPLTRTQLGDYAALNADTVSRVMSRMEHRLELIRPRRQTFHIPSLDSIAAQTPLAVAITALHGDGRMPTPAPGALRNARR